MLSTNSIRRLESGPEKYDKVLLDLSVLVGQLLDPDSLLAKQSYVGLSLEVPAALMTMILQAGTARESQNPGLLYEFVYAHVRRMHAQPPENAPLADRIRVMLKGAELRLFWEGKTREIVDIILRQYAPLIQRTGESFERSSESQHLSSDSTSFSSTGPPIRQYTASLPLSQAERSALRQAYGRVFKLRPDELFDQYFSQIHHAQRFGIAASPLVRRGFIEIGTAVFQVILQAFYPGLRIARDFVATRLENLETYTGPAQTVLARFREYVHRDREAALLGAGLDLVVEVFGGNPPLVVPILVTLAGGLIIGFAVQDESLPNWLRWLLIGLTFVAAISIVRMFDRGGSGDGPLLVIIWNGHRSFVSSTPVPNTAPANHQAPFVVNELPSRIASPTPSIVIVPTPIVVIVDPSNSVSPATPETISPTLDIGFCKHTVQPGETLSIIASRFGVTEQSIFTVQGSPVRQPLKVHQMLIVPTSCCWPSGNRGVTHVVQQRDNLASLARQYGTTVDQIVHANNLADRNYIQIGQMLCVPIP